MDTYKDVTVPGQISHFEYCLTNALFIPSYLNWFRQLPKPVTSPPWHSWTRKWGLFLWCCSTVLEVCTVPSPAAPGPQISRVANPNVSKLSKLSNFKLRIARISLHLYGINSCMFWFEYWYNILPTNNSGDDAAMEQVDYERASAMQSHRDWNSSSLQIIF